MVTKETPNNRKLCRYFDANGLINTLKDMKLRFNYVKYMNDPYDCRPPFTFDDNNFSDILINKYQNSPNGVIYSFMEKYFICSLSANCKDLLMWAHYTENYTGGILCFKKSSEIINLAKPVEYLIHSNIK